MVSLDNALQEIEFMRRYPAFYIDYLEIDPRFEHMTTTWKYLKGGVTWFLDVFEDIPPVSETILR